MLWIRRHLVLPLLLCLLLQPARGDDPQRVITLAPHLTELVFAVGAQARLVGVVDYSDFPPAAQDLPRIGDAFRFDYERILTLEADLALAWRGGTPKAAAQSLRRLGIEVVWIETNRLEQLPAAMRQLGQQLGTAQQAQTAARQFEQELAALRARHASSERPVSVFYQVSARPLYTLGGDHLLNDALAVCGMRNVFGDLEDSAPVVSREAVVAAQPELILAGASADDALAIWRTPTLQTLLDARLETIDPDRLIRPSPRILDGIRELCALRHTVSD